MLLFHHFQAKWPTFNKCLTCYILANRCSCSHRVFREEIGEGRLLELIIYLFLVRVTQEIAEEVVQLILSLGG
jgi:hypothetical protein